VTILKEHPTEQIRCNPPLATTVVSHDLTTFTTLLDTRFGTTTSWDEPLIIADARQGSSLYDWIHGLGHGVGHGNVKAVA